MPSLLIPVRLVASLSPSLHPAKRFIGQRFAQIWALVARKVGEREQAWETLNPHLLADIGESPDSAELQRRRDFFASPLGSLGAPSSFVRRD